MPRTRRQGWEDLDADEKSDQNRGAIQEAMARIRKLEDSLEATRSDLYRFIDFMNKLFEKAGKA